MESIACIFCNSSSGQEVIQESGYAGKKCDSCALIYIADRPSPQEVIDLYGHEQAHISSQSHITTSHFRYLHSRHTLGRIHNYKSAGKILEIGAGGGFFLQQARQAGFEPYALELNPTQANFIRTNGIPCEQQPLSATSFGQTKFDIIYHNDVISHFHDPKSAFATMHEKLNKDGIMVFETGNIADIDQRYYKRFTAFQYPDHLFFFGESTLKQLLANNGFDLVAYHRYGININLRLVKLSAYLTKIRSKNQTAKLDHESLHEQPTDALSRYHTPQTPEVFESSKSKQRSMNTTDRQPKKEPYNIRSVIKSLYHATLFFTRYKLGAVLPKQRRPQTMIIIAQKQSD